MAEWRDHSRTGHAAMTRQTNDFTTAAVASVTVDAGAGSTSDRSIMTGALWPVPRVRAPAAQHLSA